MSDLLALPLVVDNLRASQPMFSDVLLTLMAAELIVAREWEAAGKTWDPEGGTVDVVLLLVSYGYQVRIEKV